MTFMLEIELTLSLDLLLLQETNVELLRDSPSHVDYFAMTLLPSIVVRYKGLLPEYIFVSAILRRPAIL